MARAAWPVRSAQGQRAHANEQRLHLRGLAAARAAVCVHALLALGWCFLTLTHVCGLTFMQLEGASALVDAQIHSRRVWLAHGC